MTTTCATNCCNGAEARSAAFDEAPVFSPLADIRETPEAYIVSMDTPGAHADGVSIEVEEGVLTVSARVAQRGPASGEFIRRGYRVGDYRRSLRIGEGVDSASIAATLEAGVLTITLPKAARSRPRKIEVAQR